MLYDYDDENQYERGRHSVCGDPLLSLASNMKSLLKRLASMNLFQLFRISLPCYRIGGWLLDLKKASRHEESG